MLDILIYDGIIITMEGKGVGIINNGAIGIKGNRIEAVGESDTLKKKYRAHRYLDASNKAVLPGLIDAHIHTGIAVLRGLAQDIKNWMQEGIWPFMQILNEEAVLWGSLINIIEGVKAGTTTFCDYDSNMKKIIKNHINIGTRAIVTETVNEMPSDLSDIKVGELYPLDPSIGEFKLRENIKVIQEFHDSENGRIKCMLGPQGPDMLSKELLLEIRSFAHKHNLRIHMHIAQGDREIDQMIKRYGKRSIQFLNEIEYLDERLIGVHLTEATKEETRFFAEKNCSMVLCSGSIGIIDGIIPPMAEFLRISSKGALGSDQAPGNNCNNIFNEMKFTSILNKCKYKDPCIFPAWKILRLATIEGAGAIDMQDEIGSIKEGKKADMIIVDLERPGLFPIIKDPVRNIVPNLVYSANGSEVEYTIIDGRFIVDEGKLVTIDEKKSIKEGNQVIQRIFKNAEQDGRISMMESEYL